MIDAVTRDIAGSICDCSNIKTTSFPLFQEFRIFPDGTLPAAAPADFLLRGDGCRAVMGNCRRRCPDAGYGGTDPLPCSNDGIAETFHGGVPEPVFRPAAGFLDEPLRAVTEEFVRCFGVPLCW